ncbi:predicted protein [Verticillium alfalfae VaMs.102]|uniref:Predicted protein n=1 Tax=Verticillium alfalfae (strain VaMs.102 / ATCC MYA-4576 / FGSC 10136) TaxID=526221 RepID=C9SHH3_VERA1|nr:predicted protein [Verticillium alfalfae VaMs.102]EEY18396.1 predicted protein [Verticillium alfalfae VaMs.102]
MAPSPANNDPVAVVFRYGTDLVESDQTICDDLIIALDVCNRKEAPLNIENQKRAKFWRIVFSNDWTTEMHSFVPDPWTDPSDTQSGLQIGSLTQDCRPNPVPGLSSTIDSSHVSVARQKGCPAWLCPLPSWNKDGTAQGIRFRWVNIHGQEVPEDLVQLEVGNWSKKKALAVIHWDDCYVRHVGHHNVFLAVYWARNRLINLSKTRSSRNADQWQRGQPLNEVLASTRDLDSIGMGHRAFKRIRLCSDLMAELAEIAQDCVATMDTEKTKSFDLDDWENPEAEYSCAQGEDDSLEEEDSEQGY